MSAKLHPFESSGMGIGPYQFCGIYDLGEAMNPDSAANFGNMSGKPTGAPNLKAGLGTCACCGHGIMVVCIVKDAHGDLWGVGSDCIEKAGDASIGDAAKVAVERRRRAKARARRIAKQAAERESWLNEVCATGETNRARLERENQERITAFNAQEAARKTKEGQRAERFAGVLGWIRDMAPGDAFFQSLAEQLCRGPLSPRQAWCLANAVETGKGAVQRREALVSELTA